MDNKLLQQATPHFRTWVQHNEHIFGKECGTWKEYEEMIQGGCPEQYKEELDMLLAVEKRPEYNYATFTDKESGQEFQVEISPSLAEWLYQDEDENDYIFMAWNDALKAIDRQIEGLWQEVGVNLAIRGTYFRQAGHLLNLRDELQILATHEDNE